MKNLRIKLKLITGFLTVCLFTVITGIVGIWGMSTINSADETLYNNNLLAVSAIGEICENFQSQRVLLRSYVIFAGDIVKEEETTKAMDDANNAIQKLFADYEATITDEKSESSYYEAKEIYQNDFGAIKEAVCAESRIDIQNAIDVLIAPDSSLVVSSITTGFSSTMEYNKIVAEETVISNSELHKRMVTIQIILIAVSVLISLLLSLYISGLICRPMILLTEFMKKAGLTGDITLRPEDVKNIEKCAQVKDEIGECIGSCAKFVGRLNEVGKTLDIVAGGDLTVELALLSENDTMGVSLKKMMNSLDTMFSEINSATIQVTAGTKQVSDGSQNLAQGSTEQAAAVEQLSSSISEIAEKTKENAGMAVRASELAGAIRRNAEKGSRQMDQMLEAVKEIQEASKSISKVIKVIDDIAFQTNILALNAAVEAARAGQHGKGFAVVAEEVRSLAAKSAEAAKDTGSLIANSIEKSELGASIAGETSVSLAEIVTGINESERIVGDIATSSEEQAAAIGQINSGIEQVAHVVQQNSATAQESASASEEMSEQAHILEELVSRFKTKSGGITHTGISRKNIKMHSTPTRQTFVEENMGKY